jgi:uncharacterized phage protein gp47/JayE
MAGVTTAGFVTKRFPEILEDLKEQAVPLFQDLVTPGDVVDTSDSSVLGRLIGLTTPSLSELWEAAHQVYAAFDPNQAEGIALDNLVALGGLLRDTENPTTFSGLAWGESFTEIPSGSLVKGTTSNMMYQATSAVTLDTTDVVGAGFQVVDTTVGNSYSISLVSYAGIASLTTTAISGDTESSILGRLQTQLAAYTNYTSEITNDTLYIKIVDHYSAFNASLAGDIAWMKSAKRVEFSAIEAGPTEVALNTVTIISTPVLGWESINNPVPAIVGTGEETDTELRERFRQSKYLRASNTSDALYSALLELDGAQEIRLYVNDTDLVDSIGLDPHSFLVLMLGGSDTDIAQTIWKHTPLGIASQGAQEVAIRTSQGLEQIVKFDRPVYVPIYAEINLTTDTDFPVGGEDNIKQALSDYVTNNQTIGGKVVYSRLFGPVNETPGHEIVTLKIGLTAGTVAETTLAMAYNEIAVLPIANITII